MEDLKENMWPRKKPAHPQFHGNWWW